MFYTNTCSPVKEILFFFTPPAYAFAVKRLVALVLALVALATAGDATTAQQATGPIVFASSRISNLWGEIYTRPAGGGPARNLTRSVANDREPVLLAGGRTIAFLSNRSGQDAVWTMTTGGRRLRRVSPEYAGLDQLASSPRGTALTYIVTGQNGNGAGPLVLLDATRSTRTRLARSAWGSAFAPTGDRVAVFESSEAVSVRDRRGRVLWRVPGFRGAWSKRDDLAVSEQGRVALYSVDGRLRLRLAGTDPLWSPDGSALALTRPTGVWLVAGTTVKKLLSTHGPNYPTAIAWTPDGHSLVAFNGTGMLLVARAGGAHALPWPYATGPVWSPDGKRVALAGGLLAVSAPGSATVRVLAPRGAGPCELLYESATWLPGGKRLLYTMTRAGQNLRNLWTEGANGGSPRRLSTSSLSQETPAWSPDGATILFKEGFPNGHAGGCDVTYQPALATLRPGGTPAALTVPDANAGLVDTDPAWSPDGQQIAFVHTTFSESPENGVVVMPARGGTPRRLTPPSSKPTFYYLPEWSPAGDQIVYGSDSGVYVVPVAGGTPRRIGAGTSATWSPDGRLIALANGGGLKVVAPDGTGARSLWPMPGSNVSSGRPVWSGDGRVAVATAKGLIVARPPAVGRLVVRGALLGPAAWSPDGTRIVFVGSSTPRGLSPTSLLYSNDLFTVRPDGSGLRRLTHDDAAIAGLDWRR